MLTKKLIPVESDNEGVIPQSLKDCLSNWSPSDVGNPNSDIPKMLYTVPNASNPTGSTASGKRKREIYEVKIILLFINSVGRVILFATDGAKI